MLVDHIHHIQGSTAWYFAIDDPLPPCHWKDSQLRVLRVPRLGLSCCDDVGLKAGHSHIDTGRNPGPHGSASRCISISSSQRTERLHPGRHLSRITQGVAAQKTKGHREPEANLHHLLQRCSELALPRLSIHDACLNGGLQLPANRNPTVSERRPSGRLPVVERWRVLVLGFHDCCLGSRDTSLHNMEYDAPRRSRTRGPEN